MKRLELENDLRRGVKAEEFVVYYQPIVDLETRETWGMEALLRWKHPERGLLEATEFMLLFEESGLTVSLEGRVLKEACRQVQRWQQDLRVPALAVSVNLSAKQLASPDLVESVEDVLHETRLDPHRLSLEVTDTAHTKILEQKSTGLEHLKRLGVGISIDDSGVGHSVLSYLKKLPADVLKIDRSFVRGTGEYPKDTAIAQTIVGLAHILGMQVVAEGIEGEEQAERLREMGCDLAQGYHFSKPLPPEEVPDFLRGRHTGRSRHNPMRPKL